MTLFFLVPPIHDRPTGGNIYNRRIITELQSLDRATLVPWSPEPPFSSPVPDSDAAGIIVDSLLLRQEEAVRSLRTAHPSFPLVLLAHYLHCIDPEQSEAPEATTERSLLPLFDGAVTTSQFAKDALSTEGIPASRICVVPPGLSDAFRTGVNGPTPTDEPELLTVSNLLPGKGLPSLISTLDTLSDEPWQWTLIGDDALDLDFAKTVHRQLRDASFTERVTGPTTLSPQDLRTRYDRADIFVLPSRFETCSMAMREAMARGLPVVGYRVGGLPENLGDASAGYLVPVGEPETFEEALRTLLQSPSSRRELGAAAQERSRSFPTWRETATKFRSFVRTLG